MERDLFARRLGEADALIQNQDNREHDLLDSDDYYQFEGGIAAAVEHLSGRQPLSYHNDHSRPERPVVRTLEDEIGRVVRARVTKSRKLKLEVDATGDLLLERWALRRKGGLFADTFGLVEGQRSGARGADAIVDYLARSGSTPRASRP